MTMWDDQQDGCVFCEKVRANDGVTRDPHRPVVWFRPLNPVTSGHTLFVPMWHVEHASKDAAAGASTAFASAESFAQRMEMPYNLITSSGAVATQTIPHIHVHYVPRREGDGLPLPWTPQQDGGVR